MGTRGEVGGREVQGEEKKWVRRLGSVDPPGLQHKVANRDHTESRYRK